VRISTGCIYETHNPSRRTIDHLGPLVLHIIEELQKKTGWAFSMVMDGLNERGFRESYRCVNQFLTDIGKQVLFSCHVGWTHATQLTWQKYEENFNQTIIG